MKTLFYIGLLSIFASSCGNASSNEQESTQKTETVVALSDTLIEQSCAADPSNTYWYYASKSALESGSMMIFFDSKGNGKMPLKKYLSEAKARNCIFIGSNALKNGLLANEQQYLIGVLLDDIHHRFLQKKRSIYLCGFSGGARTASRLASQNAIVSGVIANAAPMNPSEQVQNTAMTYVAVMGTSDCNLLEALFAENALKNATFKHYFTTFPGKHEWMPLPYFRWAFDILETATNTAAAKQCAQTIDTLLQAAKKHQDIEQQASLLGLANSLFNGLAQHTAFKNSYDSLMKQATMQAFMAKQTQIYTTEMKMQDEYAQFYAQKDAEWWKKELAGLKKKSIESSADGMSAKRLLAYISMLGFIYTDKAMKQNAMEESNHFWELYHLTDPTNPDVYYLRAQYYVYSAKRELVMPQLQLAQKYGYSDVDHLLTDDVFTAFRNDTAFQAVVKRMQGL